MGNVSAMILAGGQGKRMGVLCHIRPKSLLPFAGRFRVIDFSLTNCIHSDINTIAILVDHQREIISDYLGEWQRFNSDYGNLHVLEPKNGLYNGTADAVYQNINYILDSGCGAVLVLAGDHVYRMDYRKMFQFHSQMGADVTVGVVSVPIEQAHRFGIVSLNTQCRIIDFVEKPIIPKSNLVSMGIYIFNRQVLLDHLVEDSARSSSLHDFGHTIIPEMVKRNKVFGYTFEGYWQDIGTIETYYMANMEFIREFPSLGLNDHWPILTDNNTLLASRMHCKHNVRHSIVSPSCIIMGQVENSILSPSVIVEEQAVVRESVIMANAIIGANSIVDHCILDEDVNVGRSCYIGHRSHQIQRDKDIAVVEKGVVIPDYSTVCRPFGVLVSGITWLSCFKATQNERSVLNNEDLQYKEQGRR